MISPRCPGHALIYPANVYLGFDLILILLFIRLFLFDLPLSQKGIPAFSRNYLPWHLPYIFLRSRSPVRSRVQRLSTSELFIIQSPVYTGHRSLSTPPKYKKNKWTFRHPQPVAIPTAPAKTTPSHQVWTISVPAHRAVESAESP